MSSRKEKRKSKKRALRLRDEARAAASEGNLTLAGKLVERALAEGPGNARTWLLKARLERERGNARGEEDALRTALELSPDYAEVRAELERLRAERGAPSETERASFRGGGSAPPLERTGALDFGRIGAELLERGFARLPALVSEPERAELDSLAAPRAGRVRAPSSALVDALARELYARLSPVAQAVRAELGRAPAWPRFLEGLAPPGDAGDGAEESARAESGLPYSAWVVHATALPFALEGPRGDDPFPLGALVALGPGELLLAVADERFGKGRHARGIELAPGDGAAWFARERPVRVGGALGLQPVRVALVRPPGAGDATRATGLSFGSAR